MLFLGKNNHNKAQGKHLLTNKNVWGIFCNIVIKI